jgi:hypothetical protein
LGELAPSAYREDVVSSAEEQALLKRLEELPFKPFEFHGYPEQAPYGLIWMALRL